MRSHQQRLTLPGTNMEVEFMPVSHLENCLSFGAMPATLANFSSRESFRCFVRKPTTSAQYSCSLALRDHVKEAVVQTVGLAQDAQWTTHQEVLMSFEWSQSLGMEVHQVLCLPRNLHMEVHKVLCLPRNLHMEVHKALCLPRNLHMWVHKVLRLPRNLHFKKQLKPL